MMLAKRLIRIASKIGPCIASAKANADEFLDDFIEASFNFFPIAPLNIAYKSAHVIIR